MVVLSNLEDLNASIIDNNISQKERLEKLNLTAIKQINILTNDKNIDRITLIDSKENISLFESK